MGWETMGFEQLSTAVKIPTPTGSGCRFGRPTRPHRKSWHDSISEKIIMQSMTAIHIMTRSNAIFKIRLNFLMRSYANARFVVLKEERCQPKERLSPGVKFHAKCMFMCETTSIYMRIWREQLCQSLSVISSGGLVLRKEDRWSLGDIQFLVDELINQMLCPASIIICTRTVRADGLSLPGLGASQTNVPNLFSFCSN